MLAPINMHVHVHIHAVRGYYAVALQLQIQAANPGKCEYMLQATTSLSGMLVLYILMLATYAVSCSVIWLEPLLESVSAMLVSFQLAFFFHISCLSAFHICCTAASCPAAFHICCTAASCPAAFSCPAAAMPTSMEDLVALHTRLMGIYNCFKAGRPYKAAPGH